MEGENLNLRVEKKRSSTRSSLPAVAIKKLPGKLLENYLQITLKKLCHNSGAGKGVSEWSSSAETFKAEEQDVWNPC